MLERVDHVLALGHSAEDRVPSIQMGLGCVADKELRAVGVWPGIGHAQTASRVFVRIAPRLILKPVAGAASALPIRLAALGHKIRDDPLKGQAIVKLIASQEHTVVDRFGASLANRSI